VPVERSGSVRFRRSGSCRTCRRGGRGVLVPRLGGASNSLRAYCAGGSCFFANSAKMSWYIETACSAAFGQDVPVCCWACVTPTARIAATILRSFMGFDPGFVMWRWAQKNGRTEPWGTAPSGNHPELRFLGERLGAGIFVSPTAEHLQVRNLPRQERETSRVADAVSMHSASFPIKLAGPLPPGRPRQKPAGNGDRADVPRAV
jgi:hypothetical protein